MLVDWITPLVKHDVTGNRIGDQGAMDLSLCLEGNLSLTSLILNSK